MAVAGTAAATSPQIEGAIRRRLAGDTGDAAVRAGAVVWAQGGCEVIVHLEGLSVACEAGLIDVTVELQTRESGRHPLVVSLATADPEQAPSMLALADPRPHGHPGLAARWGGILQDAIWGAVVELADERTGELPLGGVTVASGGLEAHPLA